MDYYLSAKSLINLFKKLFLHFIYFNLILKNKCANYEKKSFRNINEFK